MSRTYNKPPLIEAACSFRFSSSQPWDWTIPGLLYEKISNNFPIKEQINTVETIVDSTQGKLIQQTQPSLQFLNEDRTAIVRIAPESLSIHQLHPYNGWAIFQAQILDSLQLYYSAAHPNALNRLGLRYVNRIGMSSINFELEDYFKLVPSVPNPIPQIFPSFLLNIEVPYETPQSGLRMIFGTVVPENEERLAYILDFDMFSTNELILFSEVSQWLEIAHERISIAFDAAFTEKAHQEIFEEVNK